MQMYFNHKYSRFTYFLHLIPFSFHHKNFNNYFLLQFKPIESKKQKHKTENKSAQHTSLSGGVRLCTLYMFRKFDFSKYIGVSSEQHSGNQRQDPAKPQVE